MARLSKENEELRKSARAREQNRKFSGHMVGKVAKLHSEGVAREKAMVQQREELAAAVARNAELERALLDADLRERRMRQELGPLQQELVRLEDANRNLQRTRRTAKMFAPQDAAPSPSKAKGLDQLRTLERELQTAGQMANPRVRNSLTAVRSELEGFAHAAVVAQAREQDMLAALVDVRSRRTEHGRTDRLHAQEHSGRGALHPSRLEGTAAVRTVRGASTSPSRSLSSPTRGQVHPPAWH